MCNFENCVHYGVVDVDLVEVQQWSNGGFGGGFACGLKEEGRPIYGCELGLEENDNCKEFK